MISGYSLSFKLDEDRKVILVASNDETWVEMSVQTALYMWQVMSEWPRDLKDHEIEMDWCGCCPTFVIDYDETGWLTINNAGDKVGLDGSQMMDFLEGFFEAEDYISGMYVGRRQENS